MRPAPPVFVAHLFPELHAALIDVLRSLDAGDWQRPTVCAGWSVKDVAAHVLADDLGVLSRGRDGYMASWIETEDRDALVTAINEQNEAWVQTMRRVSPELLVELLEHSGPQLAAHFASVDLNAMGPPVTWAGPGRAPVWLDVAREYTERWLHQAQIREAAGRAHLDAPGLFAPVLATFVRALPETYRATAAADGASVRIAIAGDAGGVWSIVREAAGWQLFEGSGEGRPDASVEMDQDAAWRLFTRGLSAAAARDRVRITGDRALGEVALEAVAIIA